MPGRQRDVSINGKKNQVTAEQLLTHVASLTLIPREEDYGLDFYCAPRIEENRNASTFGLAGIQVKGMTGDLSFGGIDKEGRWKEYEITWLKTLSFPYLLARVDRAVPAVDLYSFWPVWNLFWLHGDPFKIVCKTLPASPTSYSYQEPVSEASKDVGGDRQVWSVQLGPPFLRIEHSHLADAAFLRSAAKLLIQQCARDLRVIINWLQRVAIVDAKLPWFTNDFGATYTAAQFAYWNDGPGANVGELLSALEPIVTVLGANLQAQKDPARAALVPVLELLRARGLLKTIGGGLLDGLKSEPKK